jgi:hypothetical protein
LSSLPLLLLLFTPALLLLASAAAGAAWGAGSGLEAFFSTC